MGGAAALGVIPATKTGFGYWPLWGNEAAFHALNAAVGGYFGFVRPTAADRIRYRFA